MSVGKNEPRRDGPAKLTGRAKYLDDLDIPGYIESHDPETGARFRDEVLAVGGSRPAAESFRAFRGREPSVDALLRHNGMIVR